ncbi:unnamed protein product [Acanthocheilonema viteae]|uniref:Sodium/hydrogen exchanger n=1 Tax=Acanthocheilonema viteae TaxID=6277 RepID=A0A498SEJ0_ACAVI|nr:unnamed protein product [Acanthocheilonema viteae]
MKLQEITKLFSYLLWLLASLKLASAIEREVKGNWRDFYEIAPHVEETPGRFQVISFNWEEVQKPYTIAIWLLLAGIAKMALLIVVGLMLGILLKLSNVNDSIFNLEANIFFLYLLPPIIFDAGYFMPNRALFENFGSILVFAVIGTIWNCFAIGSSLYGLGLLNAFSIKFSIFEIFLFSALISAVDPVAVIAVFEEIHVNETLFITVFGEALFNDGITVVLYQMFRKFVLIGKDKLIPIDYFAGGISFFVIGLGGTAIGLFYAFIVSFITKYTDKVKILNPIFIFLIPYMAYLTGEMFGLSSILAIVACGMAMKQYVKGNITTTAATSVKYFIKMLAQICETVIFMFLGLSTISSKHHWDLPFIVLTIIFCLVYRTIGVIVQCAILNRFRKQSFTRVDQFILCYGGLRGAIAFGLVVSMPNNINAKSMFTTACIAVIYFTVFLQGITIRPLATYLNIERERQEGPTMIQSVYMRYFDYTMAGVEDIAGQKGYNSVRDAFERLNATIFRPLLMRNQKPHQFDASKIIRAYTKITLKEAMEMASDIGPKIHMPSKSKSISDKVASSSYNNLEYLFNEKSRANDPSNLRTEIAKYMTSSENTEALYRMFSQLLDRKLRELKKDENTIEENGDDIKEDYMAEFIKPGTSVSTIDLTDPVKLESRSMSNPFHGSIRRRRRVARSHSMGNYI